MKRVPFASAVVLATFALFSSGCIMVGSGPNAGYYRSGGGIGLFLIILACGLFFGKRKR